MLTTNVQFGMPAQQAQRKQSVRQQSAQPMVKFGGPDPFDSPLFKGLAIIAVAGAAVTSPVWYPIKIFKQFKLKMALNKDFKRFENDADKMKYFNLALDTHKRDKTVENWVANNIGQLADEQNQADAMVDFLKRHGLSEKTQAKLEQHIDGFQNQDLKELMTPVYRAVDNVVSKEVKEKYATLTSDAERWAYLRDEVTGNTDIRYKRGVSDWLNELEQDSSVNPSIRLGVLIASATVHDPGLYEEYFDQFPLGTRERLDIVEMRGMLKSSEYYEKKTVAEKYLQRITDRLNAQ